MGAAGTSNDQHLDRQTRDRTIGVCSSRAGCGDLAAALLAYAMVRENGVSEAMELPAIRQPLGALPW